MHRQVLLVMVVLAALSVIAASGSLSAQEEEMQEFVKPLLLEANAEYLIDFTLPAELMGSATRVSIFVESEAGRVLKYTQLYRGLGGAGESRVVSVPLRTPPNAHQAYLHVTTSHVGDVDIEKIVIQRVLNLPDDRAGWQEQMGEGEGAYTGLVIDARGLELNRGMSPRIYSESGLLLYTGTAAPVDFVVNEGVAAYGQELSAELMWRIRVDSQYPFVAPLIINATEVVGSSRTSVTVSDEAAEKILDAVETFDFLAQFAVVFLID